MGQPEAEQSCQWWVPLALQAASQTWVCSADDVQMAWRPTFPAGIWKVASGLFGSLRVTPWVSQAEKVRAFLLPARMVTEVPAS